jgi:DNA-binding XRE family transcriptional regulator
MILGGWVRAGCARLCGVHSVSPFSVGRAPGSCRSRGATSLSNLYILARLLIFVNRLLDVLLSFVVRQECTDNGEVVKIGTQVKRVRERALLTQEELAGRAGIGTATLNRIEKDRVEPHFRTIRKLAKALDVDPSELLPEE